MNGLRDRLVHQSESILHLLFPEVCPGCGNDRVAGSQVICLECRHHLPLTGFHFHSNNPVERIFWGRVPVSSAFSQYYFSKDSIIQHLLHQLKYKGRKDIGIFLGNEMGKSICEANRFEPIDFIIPLPLHKKRERKRGFNQAAVIARGISEQTGIPMLEKVVARSTATQTQTKKSRIERWKNIEGKFLLTDPRLLEEKHVLLIDDVITTGATLESCATECLKASGCMISIGTVAFTSE